MRPGSSKNNNNKSTNFMRMCRPSRNLHLSSTLSPIPGTAQLCSFSYVIVKWWWNQEVWTKSKKMPGMARPTYMWYLWGIFYFNFFKWASCRQLTIEDESLAVAWIEYLGGVSELEMVRKGRARGWNRTAANVCRMDWRKWAFWPSSSHASACGWLMATGHPPPQTHTHTLGGLEPVQERI